MDQSGSDISQNFSTEALEIITKACKLAHQKGHKTCTSVHLLEALLTNQDLTQLLNKADLDIGKISIELESVLRNVTYPIRIKQGQVIFSPDLKTTILRSYLISQRLAVQSVGLEELLLSSLYSPEIYRLLKKLVIDIKPLEDYLISTKGGSRLQDAQNEPVLSRFTQDITAKAKNHELEEIVDRESELAQLTRILVRKTKNNVILLGEAGVGRTSIVHLLAQMVISQNIAPQLQNIKILEVNLNGLISAIATRNINELIDLLKEELQQKGDLVLFIRNLEMVSKERGIDQILMSNIIKSLLTETTNRFICTMTSRAYRELAAKESDIANRFETIKVNEPSLDLSINILTAVAKRLGIHHKIKITPDVINASVNLSKRYIQDKFLPSKAIDLLDEACSKVVLENREEVTSEDIKSVISEKTGIPIEKLAVSEQKKLINLEETLNQSVIGQNDAVHIVSEVIRRSRAGLKDPKRPIGSFLFLGPSGVGKTYLAKNLAKIVYDNENAMIRLDMSEFSESHTVQRLIGSPPGYIGYEEGGQLTNPIWERPYSLILLDEIEKAHPKVFDIFLQVLDEGRLTDGQGRTVDFKNTIIIATSNIASEEILTKLLERGENLEGFDRERFLEDEILPIVKEYFRPEFINRFDEIVTFNPLGLNELATIAELQIKKIQERIADKKITINVSQPKLTELAQKAYNPAFGARPLIRLIQDQVENIIARKIISGEIKEGDTINL